MKQQREKKGDGNTEPQTESSPQGLIQSLYCKAAGLGLRMASFWKFTLLLPIGEKMYLFYILISVTGLPVAWAETEMLIIIVQIMCMEGSVYINPHLDVN